MKSAPDQLVRATILNGRGRALACVTTNVVNEMQGRHHTWPVATAALGRTASIALMMGQQLKNEERLTLRIDGDGPLGRILVDADAFGNVRGYVDNPFVDLPANSKGKLDVGRAVGRGTLYVTRDTGLRDYYTGSAAIQTGEIADDFTYYFAVSEQTPSAVGAGVLVGTDNRVICAGGFLLQLLPGHEENDIEKLEERLSSMQSVTDILQTGKSAEELLYLLDPDAHLLNRVAVQFACNCSRERFAAAMKNLDVSELRSMVEEDKGAEAVCHFCAAKYFFGVEEIEGWIAEQQS